MMAGSPTDHTAAQQRRPSSELARRAAACSQRRTREHATYRANFPAAIASGGDAAGRAAAIPRPRTAHRRSAAPTRTAAPRRRSAARSRARAAACAVRGSNRPIAYDVSPPSVLPTVATAIAGHRRDRVLRDERAEHDLRAAGQHRRRQEGRDEQPGERDDRSWSASWQPAARARPARKSLQLHAYPGAGLAILATRKALRAASAPGGQPRRRARHRKRSFARRP